MHNPIPQGVPQAAQMQMALPPPQNPEPVLEISMQSEQNQQFEIPPAVSDGVYIHRMPPWLAMVLRVVFAAGGLGFGALASGEWARMPLFFRALVAVLVPSFLLLALHPRILAPPIYFLADDHGMYFPDSASQLRQLGRGVQVAWLFVPWSRLSNLRIAWSGGGERSRGVALEVAATREEAAEFFRHLDAPADARRTPEDLRAVLFDTYPPSPARTLAILQGLKQGRPNPNPGGRR